MKYILVLWSPGILILIQYKVIYTVVLHCAVCICRCQFAMGFRRFGASLLDWQVSQPITVSWGVCLCSFYLATLLFPDYDTGKSKSRLLNISWENSGWSVAHPDIIHWGNPYLTTTSFWSAVVHHTSCLIMSAPQPTDNIIPLLWRFKFRGCSGASQQEWPLTRCRLTVTYLCSHCYSLWWCCQNNKCTETCMCLAENLWICRVHCLLVMMCVWEVLFQFSQPWPYSFCLVQIDTTHFVLVITPLVGDIQQKKVMESMWSWYGFPVGRLVLDG